MNMIAFPCPESDSSSRLVLRLFVWQRGQRAPQVFAAFEFGMHEAFLVSASFIVFARSSRSCGH